MATAHPRQKPPTASRSAGAKTKAGHENPFGSAAVAAAFMDYPPPVRVRLLALRRLIFETAAAISGVGTLDETLKWGQPSYLTAQSGSGSTVRIDRVKPGPKDGEQAERYAVYFNCRTDLVAMFRELYPEIMTYGGNRSIVFDLDQAVPKAALRHCIALALTYHLKQGRDAL